MTRQRIVIIGASSHIAEHCARLWAKQPIDFVLVGRDTARVQRVADDLKVRSPGSSADVIEADFHDPAAITALAKSGELWRHMSISAIEFALGYAIASVLGVIIGFAMAESLAATFRNMLLVTSAPGQQPDKYSGQFFGKSAQRDPMAMFEMKPDPTRHQIVHVHNDAQRSVLAAQGLDQLDLANAVDDDISALGREMRIRDPSDLRIKGTLQGQGPGPESDAEVIAMGGGIALECGNKACNSGTPFAGRRLLSLIGCALRQLCCGCIVPCGFAASARMACPERGGL